MDDLKMLKHNMRGLVDFGHHILWFLRRFSPHVFLGVMLPLAFSAISGPSYSAVSDIRFWAILIPAAILIEAGPVSLSRSAQAQRTVFSMFEYTKALLSRLPDKRGDIEASLCIAMDAHDDEEPGTCWESAKAVIDSVLDELSDEEESDNV